MSSPPALNNAALPILPQPRPVSPPRSVAHVVVASPNSGAGSDGSGAGAPVTQAEISRLMFSVDSLNVTAMKVRLMERAGNEFGIDQGDYESVTSYGSAVGNAVEALKRQTPAAIVEVERQLGLDQLGIALDTLVNAITNPQGSDRLDAALETHLGKTASDEATSLQPDEIGLYGG
ncbi:hypothetical protein [Mesorhizobium sp.]|uniref:hypothetical protein n=1 Tax=Mesorhizobium sp. TaxID=1871066 RepID=UPI000FE35F25|nr:hypothetical protein [Mesorhizobium sp.]RWA66091.1 MAG: hypothetical protein EOQ28_28445 [Mesorhizobium sp.]RWB95965.1 MAG: hypothetical protein EOQ57_27950 [Mesorhizobium sp.]RWG78250.1 MAG: hypothetical protein EOQ69_26720 [Mesorhizobium sp.]RWG79703.1 MAG: hypothetical protein EOQ70_28310 [Mesorhizobium sp.]RWJ98969.1 MAG: hypothetical protein EOR42_26015 [Mesorhizobium sp.]